MLESRFERGSGVKRKRKRKRKEEEEEEEEEWLFGILFHITTDNVVTAIQTVR